MNTKFLKIIFLFSALGALHLFGGPPEDLLATELELSSLVAELAKLNQAMPSLESKKVDLTNKLTELEIKKADLENQIKKLNEPAEKLEFEIAQLEENKKSVQQKLDDALMRLEPVDVDGEVKKFEEECFKKYTEKYAELSEQNRELNKNIRDLESESFKIEEQMRKNGFGHSDNISLGKELERKNKEVEQLKETRTENYTELKYLAPNLAGSLKAVDQGQLVELKKDLNERARKAQNLVAETKRLQKEMSNLAHFSYQKKEELKKVCVPNTAGLKHQCHELDVEIQALEVEKNTVEEKLGGYSKAVAEKEKLLEIKQAKKVELEDKIKNLPPFVPPAEPEKDPEEPETVEPESSTENEPKDPALSVDPVDPKEPESLTEDKPNQEDQKVDQQEKTVTEKPENSKIDLPEEPKKTVESLPEKEEIKNPIEEKKQPKQATNIPGQNVEKETKGSVKPLQENIPTPSDILNKSLEQILGQPKFEKKDLEKALQDFKKSVVDQNKADLIKKGKPEAQAAQEAQKFADAEAKKVLNQQAEREIKKISDVPDATKKELVDKTLARLMEMAKTSLAADEAKKMLENTVKDDAIAKQSLEALNKPEKENKPSDQSSGFWTKGRVAAAFVIPAVSALGLAVLRKISSDRVAAKFAPKMPTENKKDLTRKKA